MFNCNDCEGEFTPRELLVTEHDSEVMIICLPCDDLRRGPENPREWVG